MNNLSFLLPNVTALKTKNLNLLIVNSRQFQSHLIEKL